MTSTLPNRPASPTGDAPKQVVRERRPPLALVALEPERAVADLALFGAFRPLLQRLPGGDGHGVLVLPGFTADDNSTRPLRGLLRDWGYRAHGWRLGINVGPTDRILDGLTARTAAILEAEGGRPISIIGWSLGGIYAREIARQAPEMVRNVITMGSPFRIEDREESNASFLYNLLSTFHSTRLDGEEESVGGPIPVPTTAIFSKTDAIVPWRTTMGEVAPRAESIEVLGAHSGLGFNPAAMLIIADRLAQAEGTWKPFAPSRSQRALFRLPRPRR